MYINNCKTHIYICVYNLFHPSDVLLSLLSQILFSFQWQIYLTCIRTVLVVVQLLCPTLCNLMDICQSSLSSTISQSLLKFIFIELVRFSNHLVLCHPSSPFALNLAQHLGSFPMSRLFTSGGQSIGTSASATVLPMTIQSWFPPGLTGLISLPSKGLSRAFSSTTIWKHHFFFWSLSLSPTLIFIHDYWKNHTLDYTDLSQQTDVSAF